MQVPWRTKTRARWLREAEAWTAENLSQLGMGRTGPLEPVKDRPWAIVMRVSTPRGSVYFKANAPGGVHEPALVTALAQHWPDRIPEPLACDEPLGWMLLPDHGSTLRDALDGRDGLESWERLLPLYAEVQLDSARDPARWLELRVPDRRLDALPGLLSALLGDDAALLIGRAEGLDERERAAMLELLPELEARCRELGSMPNAAALEHGDLHDGNILVGDGTYWLFDWADSSVTHPFISLLVTCNTQVEDFGSADGQKHIGRLRDAYLEPWTTHAPARSLRELFSTALWIGHVSRALDWNHMLRGTGAADFAEWQPNVPRWLRLWIERRPLLV